ncbi:metallophosphoesterase [Neorhizobium alkalisoli]|uniref:3',5'-cyclic AMP phosphodiesterase CpdA n=1 Tax=Neorhizobium alkalisoli TaxID=528178 RepID=A0A561Q0V8_9HYPH|nr:metallophosphoesterase [Neorhizobium alkalisoli]TWF44016.1 3',5'-cyclic AMP phosphodiesterase CpdA [Neorhizobium alkalisoli]
MYSDRLLKLVVMSDLHLLPEGQLKNSLDTAERLERAFADVMAYHADADLVVFAGDIADKADVEAYQAFEVARAKLPLRQRVMLGNHDNRNVYLQHAVDPMVDEHGFIEGVADIKGHRIVMLDTSEPGMQSRLCEKRLDWLAARLDEARAAGLKVILLLHHNPVALQMPVDTYRLGEPQKLLDVLKRSGAEIIQILAGHCHIQTAGSWGGYPCATIVGNAHRAGQFLRPRLGQQPCYEGPAQYAAILSDGLNCALHFHNYVEFDPEIPASYFPRKLDQPYEKVD